MSVQIVEKITDCLAADGRVKFAYLFGSVARGATGPLSDIDIAVYLDGRIDRFNYQLKLMESLARAMKTENFDLVVLNDVTPLLGYEIIRSGVVLKENRSKRILFETRVMREYLDTAYLRDVRCQYLKDKALSGGFLGK